MSELEYRSIHPSEAAGIVNALRQTDRDELEAAVPVSAPEAIERHLERSLWHGAAFEPDGSLVAIWGIVTPSACSCVGHPWCFTGDAVTRHAREFLYQSRYLVKIWQRDFHKLEGFVDERHEAARRWLAWLGFSLSEPQPYGWSEMMFRRYHWGFE